MSIGLNVYKSIFGYQSEGERRRPFEEESRDRLNDILRMIARPIPDNDDHLPASKKLSKKNEFELFWGSFWSNVVLLILVKAFIFRGFVVDHCIFVLKVGLERPYESRDSRPESSDMNIQ